VLPQGSVSSYFRKCENFACLFISLIDV